jgi:ABC-type uncharacterized transport system substrate-binding protein
MQEAKTYMGAAWDSLLMDGWWRANVGRRDFVALLGGAIAGLPFAAARAQQTERVQRVGILMNLAENDPEGQQRLAAVRHGLHELRWREGTNLRFDLRWWASGDSESLRAQAAELVRLAPDVLFASGGRALEALQLQTRSIPIVFVVLSNPMAQGFIHSLARPGGNSTGFSQYEATLLGKLLETLMETAPDVSRILLMFHPDNPGYSGTTGYLRSFDEVVRGVGLDPIVKTIHDGADIERAVIELARTPNGGLLMPPDAVVLTHRDLLIRLAAAHHLPAAYSYPVFARNGGLISYGVDLNDLYRRAASYVDRMLKGENPADLPVQAPVKYEMVLNLKTAKALGLTVPDKLLALADEVIE